MDFAAERQEVEIACTAYHDALKEELGIGWYHSKCGFQRQKGKCWRIKWVGMHVKLGPVGHEWLLNPDIFEWCRMPNVAARRGRAAAATAMEAIRDLLQ